MRRTLVLLALMLGASVLMTRPSLAQFATCDHAYVATFDVPEIEGSEPWSAGTIECVEFFRFSFSTPRGTRWIRGVGDVNLETMLAPGAIDAAERGARLAAQRMAALGDYTIENTTILLTFSTAESLASEPASGRTAAWTLPADGPTPGARECHVTMFLLNDYSVDVEIPYAVSHELFHCVQEGTLTPAQMATHSSGGSWWVEGSADLFAATVINTDEHRWDRARQFDDDVAAGRPVYEMGYAAAVLFWWMYGEYGLESLLPLLREMPTSGSTAAQRAALRNAFDEEEWMDFVQSYADRTIRYPGLSSARFGEPEDGETWSIGATSTHRLPLRPFVVTLGWAEYECGVWGNRVNEANARAKEGDSWERWPAETDGRGGGGARYRIAAIHTGDENTELNLRTERRESCSPCMAAAAIDRCLVGVWRQSGGGPVEYLRSRGIPFTRTNVTPLEITMNDDGTFTTSAVGIDVEITERMPTGVARGTGVGETSPTRGRWSAAEGELQGCFDGGGTRTGVTISEASGAPIRFISPWDGGGVAGEAGSTTYTCSATTFTTSSPTRYGPMTYEFTRITPPPRD